MTNPMLGFAYRVTLVGGQYSIARNGVELDRLMFGRWETVQLIEVLEKNDPRIVAPAHQTVED